ncbi:hypothetical protein QBC43DRAFT_310609 [Cladorrhinum sp. PSN259]|nr:hypothetical protein QBC43DRAFT_310609 [Cladorrhinum sp. PSN259]
MVCKAEFRIVLRLLLLLLSSVLLKQWVYLLHMMREREKKIFVFCFARGMGTKLPPVKQFVLLFFFCRTNKMDRMIYVLMCACDVVSQFV